MKTKCPENNVDLLCETIDSSDLLRNLPVVDEKQSVVYRNVFCARCNHVRSVSYWSMAADCGRIPASALPTDKALFMAFIKENCTINYTPTDRQHPHIKTCLKAENTCSSKERVEKEPILEKLCSFYAFPVCGNSFKNPHCALCNGDDITQYGCGCAILNPTTDTKISTTKMAPTTQKKSTTPKHRTTSSTPSYPRPPTTPRHPTTPRSTPGHPLTPGETPAIPATIPGTIPGHPSTPRTTPRTTPFFPGTMPGTTPGHPLTPKATTQRHPTTSGTTKETTPRHPSSLKTTTPGYPTIPGITTQRNPGHATSPGTTRATYPTTRRTTPPWHHTTPGFPGTSPIETVPTDTTIWYKETTAPTFPPTPPRVTVLPPPPPPPPLNILFDFSPDANQINIQGKTTVITHQTCKEGFVYDPFVDTCREVFHSRVVINTNSSVTNSTNSTIEFSVLNCSFIRLNISNTIQYPNGTMWVLLYQTIYNKTEYVVNGSYVFVCSKFRSGYSMRETV